MLQIQTILPNTLELLKRLSSRPEMQGMRLVGGTSLALQIGHRQSIDLDFFGKPAASQDEILDMLVSFGNYRIRNRTNNILQLIVNNVMVDIVDYSRYPWIDPPLQYGSITLASPKDIAAMKINAIEGRGSKKSFCRHLFPTPSILFRRVVRVLCSEIPQPFHFPCLTEPILFQRC